VQRFLLDTLIALVAQCAFLLVRHILWLRSRPPVPPPKINHAKHPEILAHIIQHADAPLLRSFRATCRALRDTADRVSARHIIADGSLFTCTGVRMRDRPELYARANGVLDLYVPACGCVQQCDCLTAVARSVEREFPHSPSFQVVRSFADSGAGPCDTRIKTKVTVYFLRRKNGKTILRSHPIGDSPVLLNILYNTSWPEFEIAPEVAAKIDAAECYFMLTNFGRKTEREYWLYEPDCILRDLAAALGAVLPSPPPIWLLGYDAWPWSRFVEQQQKYHDAQGWEDSAMEYACRYHIAMGMASGNRWAFDVDATREFLTLKTADEFARWWSRHVGASMSVLRPPRPYLEVQNEWDVPGIGISKIPRVPQRVRARSVPRARATLD
jgi:hypothetical protein